MPERSTALAPPQPEFSAGLAPGKLPGVDGRSWTARRYRELVAGMASDVGCELTVAKTAIVCRAPALLSWCERAEAEHANGGKFNIGEYTTAVNTLRRLLADIGLERVTKDVPNLSEWLRRRETEAV